MFAASFALKRGEFYFIEQIAYFFSCIFGYFAILHFSRNVLYYNCSEGVAIDRGTVEGSQHQPCEYQRMCVGDVRR